MSELWEKLCTPATLKKGWHLTKEDCKQDFFEESFATETFAYFLEENIDELLRVLRLGDYQPRPMKRVSIPKGALSTRPGTLLSLEDRVVLFGALSLIAESIDSNLSDEVYSYRVKKGDKRRLFHESDVISMPFLKSKTVKEYIDPFDPWYGLWPKFDAISRKAFQENEYRFMATSDIAAYFENIQLDILRDQLHSFLPQEQPIINLFYTAFSSWTYDTAQGKRYMRGIPQGSQISSFFGNIFLKPIDDAFLKFKQTHDIQYYRYMDDIRVFGKQYRDVRAALLLLDDEIRRLHLNLQTAKTKIYDESLGEVTAALIDRRFRQLDDIGETIQKHFSAETPEEAEAYSLDDARLNLEKVYEEDPSKKRDEQKIKGARKPLKGMSDRVFRRLLTLHLRVDSDQLVDRLLSEIIKNADYRLGLKLIQYARRFPRKKTIQTKLMKFIQSEENVLPFQESQILKAMRYQSRLEKSSIEHSLERAKDKGQDPYVRAQAFHLLSRTKLTNGALEAALSAFSNAEKTVVKKSAALVLMRQRGRKNKDFVQSIVFHPNDSIRRFGKFIQVVKNNREQAEQVIKQAFKEDQSFLMVDYLPFLYLIAESRDTNIINLLTDRIKSSRLHKEHVNMDIRDRLSEILSFGEQNIRGMSQASA